MSINLAQFPALRIAVLKYLYDNHDAVLRAKGTTTCWRLALHLEAAMPKEYEEFASGLDAHKFPELRFEGPIMRKGIIIGHIWQALHLEGLTTPMPSSKFHLLPYKLKAINREITGN